MRILLAGSTGLIGSTVAARLRPQHTLVTLGRQSQLVDITADLANCEQLAALELPPSDCLVHCAGVIDEDFKNDPTSAYRRATLGAEALLSAASNAGCTRYIYISSTHVYGTQAGAIDEDAPVNPQSHYALAHYCTEQLFRRQTAAHSSTSVVLRPNAVFGLPLHPESFQRWSLVPFSFPREAKEHGRITLKSTGLQKRNFVSTAAIADLIARCIDGDLADATGAIHVLGAVTESVYDFAQRCQRIAERQLGRPCVVERPAVAATGNTVGADFSLISRFTQQRAPNELDDFISEFISQC